MTPERIRDDVQRELPLVDRFQRAHRSLRVSVTDVCNIRCQYCMPDGKVPFMPSERHLSFGQLAEFVRVTASLGVTHYRLTGGEPLMRPDLYKLIELLVPIRGVQEVALTTNGMFLAEQLPQLVSAGLSRVNISLDTLSEESFQRLSRRAGLHRVLEGIEAVLAQPGVELRLNALVLRDVNLDDVVDLVSFARQRGVVIRFIEFMPLDGQRAWSQQRMVSGDELRQRLVRHFGPLTIKPRPDSAQPSTDYVFCDGTAVGFIDSVTRPFCGNCDRLRITSDGKIRNCLFGKQEWDVAPQLLELAHLSQQWNSAQFEHTNTSAAASSLPLAYSAAQQQVVQIIRDCVAAKAAAHGVHDLDFHPPERAMYQIGG
ncbi:MAG: GTP 3',8-cyclase MoaA [Pirellulaceae bacterium]|nr:GTP 3',8-cyclase MoaA [Pirellulaceae bacterium]